MQWPWQKQNKNLAAEAQPEQPPTSHAAPDTALTRTQLCRLRKLERIVQRIRVQDQRCGLSLEMAARQGFRPEVDRMEALRLRRLVDQYIRLVSRAKDEVGLDIEKTLSREDQQFIQRVLDDHHRPVTEGPLPLDVQLFLETGFNITAKQPARKQATLGDGLDQLLR